jgi:hypothetical protein
MDAHAKRCCEAEFLLALRDGIELELDWAGRELEGMLNDQAIKQLELRTVRNGYAALQRDVMVLTVNDEALPLCYEKLATVENVVAVKQCERDVHALGVGFSLQ